MTSAITESAQNQLLVDYAQALDRAEEVPESQRPEYRNRIDAAFRIAMEQLQGFDLKISPERIKDVRNAFNRQVVNCVNTYKETKAIGLLQRIGARFLQPAHLPTSTDLEPRIIQQIPKEARAYCGKVVKAVSAQLGGKPLPNEQELNKLVGVEAEKACGRPCPGMVLTIKTALESVRLNDTAIQFPLMP